MYKMKNNNKGQTQLGEYVITAIIVIGAITAMSTFYSRLVQGRVRDAHIHMWREFRDRTTGHYNGPFYIQYEPYYVNTYMEARQRLDATTQLLPSGPGTTGIYRKQLNDRTGISMDSATAAPGVADEEFGF
jgi:hypothetical protein